jgi:hypothetical protein
MPPRGIVSPAGLNNCFNLLTGQAAKEAVRPAVAEEAGSGAEASSGALAGK